MRTEAKLFCATSANAAVFRARASAGARARKWIILLSAVLMMLPVAEIFAAKRDQVSHVVFIWMKRPGNVADQQLLIRAAKRFRKIRGVVRVDTGAGMAVRRPGIDQAFDIGAVITFRDQNALQDYEKDPRHLAAMRQVLQPLARRYVVYNFRND